MFKKAFIGMALLGLFGAIMSYQALDTLETIEAMETSVGKTASSSAKVTEKAEKKSEKKAAAAAENVDALTVLVSDYKGPDEAKFNEQVERMFNRGRSRVYRCARTVMYRRQSKLAKNPPSKAVVDGYSKSIFRRTVRYSRTGSSKSMGSASAPEVTGPDAARIVDMDDYIAPTVYSEKDTSLASCFKAMEDSVLRMRGEGDESGLIDLRLQIKALTDRDTRLLDRAYSTAALKKPVVEIAFDGLKKSLQKKVRKAMLAGIETNERASECLKILWATNSEHKVLSREVDVRKGGKPQISINMQEPGMVRARPEYLVGHGTKRVSPLNCIASMTTRPLVYDEIVGEKTPAFKYTIMLSEKGNAARVMRAEKKRKAAEAKKAERRRIAEEKKAARLEKLRAKCEPCKTRCEKQVEAAEDRRMERKIARGEVGFLGAFTSGFKSGMKSELVCSKRCRRYCGDD